MTMTLPDVDLEAMLAVPLPPCVERWGGLTGRPVCGRPSVMLIRRRCVKCRADGLLPYCREHLDRAAWYKSLGAPFHHALPCGGIGTVEVTW